MNKEFDKIIERLENASFWTDSSFDEDGYCNDDSEEAVYLHKAIEIVKHEAEQYNNGWIPCSEQLPEECAPVNVTWINRKPESYYAKIKDVPFSATAVYYNSQWYWYSSTCVDYISEYGKNDFDLVDKDIDIVAWQPLPKPFQPKGEREAWS